MVTRRGLIVGSASVAGALAVGAATASPAQAAASGFALPGGLFCPVPFMSRSAWGADESLRFTNNGGYWATDFHPVQTITIHHGGFQTNMAPADLVRSVYVNQTTRGDSGIGWGDIGYHLLIDAQGVVYEGRYSGTDPSIPDQYPVFNPSGQMVTGAHVLHYNSGNIGICMLGYLSYGYDGPPTAAAQSSLVTVLGYLAAVAGLNPLSWVNYYNPVPLSDGTHTTRTVVAVCAHRDWASTECPGNALYPLMNGIRAGAAAAMPAAPPPPPPPTTAAPTTDPTSTAEQTQPPGEESGSPSESGTGSAATTPPPAPPPPAPTAAPPAAGTPPRDRGGDEYVPAARSANPSQYIVSPTPTLPPTPSGTRSRRPGATHSGLPLTVGDAAGGGGLGWPVPTAIGVGAGGVLAALAWVMVRRRQLAAAGAVGPSLTVVDPPTLVPETAPTQLPGPEEEQSTEESPPPPRPATPPEDE